MNVPEYVFSQELLSWVKSVIASNTLTKADLEELDMMIEKGKNSKLTLLITQINKLNQAIVEMEELETKAKVAKKKAKRRKVLKVIN